jgi:phosphate starvation-inducible PhoH-like protein
MSADRDRISTLGPGELHVSLVGVDQFALLGTGDRNLRLLEDRLDGTITVRGEQMVLKGPPAQIAALAEAVLKLIDLLSRERELDAVSVGYVIEQQFAGEPAAENVAGETLYYATGTRRAIRAKTAGQQVYVDAIRDHDVVFSIGPAGTGKTYLAVVLAMDYLKRGLVERIVLVRPAVEAGEQLGFLPGDMQEKIDPYLRPLYDALADTIGPSRIQRYMSDGIIEAAPLAYMRGRTLNNAFVILDEAQNTTLVQMKMFLTRLGHHAKSVITGDVTQIDLDGGKRSGLVGAYEILQGTEGIAFVELTRDDVVRHPLVKRIVEAFRTAEERENGARSP